MKQRVPDEYFRPNAESDDVSAKPPRRRVPDSPGVRAVPVARVREGLTPRALAIVLVLLAALTFAIGRIFVFPGAPEAAPSREPTSSVSTSATPTADPLAPYDGPTTGLSAAAVEGECRHGWSPNPPAGLIDTEESTLWSCEGNGIDESLTFLFDEPVTLAGLRLINGNTRDKDRYPAERRIVSVRWTFSDGSFFDQGLAAGNRSLQEVRFPRREVTSVRMQVLDTTRPGSTDPDANRISISAVEFLEPG